MTSPTLKTKYNFSDNYYSAYASKKLGDVLKNSYSKITEEHLKISKNGKTQTNNLLKSLKSKELIVKETLKNAEMFKINQRKFTHIDNIKNKTGQNSGKLI